MSVDNIDKIDLIGTEKEKGFVSLLIADHLDWSDEELHLSILQDKINSYISFIESGQVYEDYPSAKGKKINIDIISKYPYPRKGKLFIERANQVTLKGLDVLITHAVHK